MKTSLLAGTILALVALLPGPVAKAQEDASKAQANAAPVIVKSTPVDFHACQLPPGKLIFAIDLSVAEDGTPRNVRMGQSSGVPCLDDAAVAAVKTYVFRPAMKNGKAVSTPLHLSMNLGGAGEKTPVPAEVPSLTGELTKAGTPVYKIVGSVVPPKPIEMPDLKKPEGLSGHLTATVSCVVNEQGKPENLHVDQSSNIRFDSYALDHVSKYRFHPATLNGKPVAVKMAVKEDYDY